MTPACARAGGYGADRGAYLFLEFQRLRRALVIRVTFIEVTVEELGLHGEILPRPNVVLQGHHVIHYVTFGDSTCPIPSRFAIGIVEKDIALI